MLYMVYFKSCIGATDQDPPGRRIRLRSAAIGRDRPRSAAIGRDEAARIYELKWPSSALSALLLPQACCRGYAAGAMLQGLYCRGYAARAMLQGLCCKGYAARALL